MSASAIQNYDRNSRRTNAGGSLGLRGIDTFRYSRKIREDSLTYLLGGLCANFMMLCPLIAAGGQISHGQWGPFCFVEGFFLIMTLAGAYFRLRHYRGTVSISDALIQHQGAFFHRSIPLEDVARVEWECELVTSDLQERIVTRSVMIHGQRARIGVCLDNYEWCDRTEIVRLIHEAFSSAIQNGWLDHNREQQHCATVRRSAAGSFLETNGNRLEFVFNGSWFDSPLPHDSDYRSSAKCFGHLPALPFVLFAMTVVLATVEMIHAACVYGPERIHVDLKHDVHLPMSILAWFFLLILVFGTWVAWRCRLYVLPDRIIHQGLLGTTEIEYAKATDVRWVSVRAIEDPHGRFGEAVHISCGQDKISLALNVLFSNYDKENFIALIRCTVAHDRQTGWAEFDEKRFY